MKPTFKQSTWWRLFPLLVLTSCLGQTATQTSTETVYLHFAVLAMTSDTNTRRMLEDQLVARLLQDNYDAVPSYTLMPNVDEFPPAEVRRELLQHGIQAILLLRPEAINGEVSISTARDYLSPTAYNSVAEFVSAYRGDNLETQAVVHVAGFLLDQQRSRLFWQGVIWLDDPVTNQVEGVGKIADLVQYNLNQSRGALRQQLGYPPLTQ